MNNIENQYNNNLYNNEYDNNNNDDKLKDLFETLKKKEEIIQEYEKYFNKKNIRENNIDEINYNNNLKKLYEKDLLINKKDNIINELK